MEKILLFIIIVVSFSACKNKGENCSTYFELPLHVIPEQSTYKTGDTITFVSKFHKELLAYNSNAELMDETFDMEGILWDPYTTLNRIDILNEDTFTSIIPKYFEIIDNESHYILKDAGHMSGEYQFSKDTFTLKYKLIPNTSGTFYLIQASSILPSKNDQDYPGKCFDFGGGFAVWYKVNDGTDNNIDFLMESPIKSFHKRVTRDPLWDFHREGGYCFKVVE